MSESTTFPQAAQPSYVPVEPGDAPKFIRWCYRLFLDREPENDDVIRQALPYVNDPAALRRRFLSSDEFLQKGEIQAGPTLKGDEPPMSVDVDASDSDMRLLFDRVQKAWEELGETEPHWSVLSLERFMAERMGQPEFVEEFDASGKHDTDLLFAALRRNGVQTEALRVCLEYGCGLGRVTRWLAERFEHVHAVDISRSHLLVAQAHLERQGIHNVTLNRIDRVDDVERLPKVDFVFSVIVLQHNPPPVIAYTLERLIGALNPGGVALLQIPSYRLGYTFSLEQYLAGALEPGGMEMHFLPQHRIFSIVRAAGAQVLEVLEDGRIGTGRKDVSNTFLLRRD